MLGYHHHSVTYKYIASLSLYVCFVLRLMWSTSIKTRPRVKMTEMEFENIYIKVSLKSSIYLICVVNNAWITKEEATNHVALDSNASMI